MEQFDVVVIGAGISGLSMAHYCRKAGMQTLVLEKSPRSGGCFHSHQFTGDAAGFWLELGAHTCYNSYTGLISILEDCGLMKQLLPRQKVPFRMLVDGRVVSIASQLSFHELLTSAWRIFSLKKEGESVASYYSRIVGRQNFQRVFSPAFNAVISQQADNFPADMLFNKRPRRKDVLRSFTVAGGLQTITDSLASQPGVTLRTNTTITGIAFDAGIFTITTADGASIQARHLAVAIPPADAAQLLNQAFPQVADKLSQIRMETVETVGVAVSKPLLSLEPVAGIIAPRDSFYSAVSRDTVPHASWRGFSFHFKAGPLPGEERLARIGSVLNVSPANLQQAVSRENRLPSPVVGHHALVADIDAILAKTPLLLTGNYFIGMAIEDCITRSRVEFARIGMR